MGNTITIRIHPRELHDLQEFFCLLTKQCNSNCEFCIERKVHTGDFMNKENFISSVDFAKEYGLCYFFSSLILGMIFDPIQKSPKIIQINLKSPLLTFYL